jgi:sugar diacid utilization regulator
VAADAGWPLPLTLAAMVISGPADADRLASRLGVDVIAMAEDEAVIAYIPDPAAPGRRAEIASAVHDREAALGPVVAPARAHHSLSRARAALRLAADDRVDAGQLIVADDLLLELLLHSGDSALGAELAAAELAPLAQLTAGSRARLLQTLRAWLDHPGQVQRVAVTLGVHPQTVRYRVAQLRELFGESIEEAERRFRLSVALRVAPPTGI